MQTFPKRLQPGRARRHRRQLEQQTTRYPRLADPAGGLRADLGLLPKALDLSSLNRVLRFGLETAW